MTWPEPRTWTRRTERGQRTSRSLLTTFSPPACRQNAKLCIFRLTGALPRHHRARPWPPSLPFLLHSSSTSRSSSQTVLLTFSLSSAVSAVLKSLPPPPRQILITLATSRCGCSPHGSELVQPVTTPTVDLAHVCRAFVGSSYSAAELQEELGMSTYSQNARSAPPRQRTLISVSPSHDADP